MNINIIVTAAPKTYATIAAGLPMGAGIMAFPSDFDNATDVVHRIIHQLGTNSDDLTIVIEEHPQVKETWDAWLSKLPDLLVGVALDKVQYYATDTIANQQSPGQ